MAQRAKKQSRRTEGIDISDALTIHRESTCDKILEDIADEQVMLIRGPPFSGKTSLATLVYERAQTLGSFDNVVKFSLLFDDMERKVPSHKGVPLSLQGLCRADEDTDLGKVLIIVDEIQMCYDQANAALFWNTVKAIQQQAPRYRHLFVLMLGSYGGEKSVRGGSSTPVHLDNPRGLELLRFSTEEYAQLVQAFNQRVAPEQFALNERMSSALFHFTLGIPGLTVLALNKFQSEYIESAGVITDPPTESDFLGFLLGRFVEDCERTRAVSSRWTERSEAKAFVRMLLEEEGPCGLDPALEVELIKDGIVARVSERLEFSAPIVRVIVAKTLFRNMPTLPDHVTPVALRDFDKFVIICLQRMERKALCNNISEGIDGKIYERALQMEFYRAAVPLADRIGGICCPDAGSVFDSRGFLDFYINKSHKWAFELTRNSSLLDEHVRRFSPHTGIYRSVPINRWAVINFVQCTGRFRKPTNVRDGEVRVSYSKITGSFQVYRKIDDVLECTVGSFA